MDDTRRLLLVTPFKPYGIENKFNRKGDDLLMDLLAARLTRESGPFALSGTFDRGALHLIAANIQSPAKVLEYPTIEQFIEEVKRNYELIGITFVVKEVLKVAHMITIVRKLSPKTKIIVGGFGTMIPTLGNLGADYVCDGEGVSFMRKLLNEDVERPRVHPPITAELSIRSLKKYPFVRRHKVGVIVNGFGCPNGCEYCCTSHFYGKKHVPFLESGREVLEVMDSFATSDSNVRNFVVWEEDFFLYKDHLRQLQAAVRERGEMPYSFACFGSISALSASGLTIDEMVEMGVSHIWIGVESLYSDLAKRKGGSVKGMFDALHAAGISTTGSMIFGLDCQNPGNIQQDLDHFISLNPTTNQLSCIMVTPGTGLFERAKEEQRLRPLKDWRDTDLYKESLLHAHFVAGELTKTVFAGYERIYQELGPSLLRATNVYLNGYERFRRSDNPVLRQRAEIFRSRVVALAPYLLFSGKLLPSVAARRKRDAALARMRDLAVHVPVRGIARGAFAAALFGLEKWLGRFSSDEPATAVTYYN